MTRTLLILTLGALAGCASVDTTPPPVELPPATNATALDLTQWWRRFNDPALDALIDEAMRANLDLAAAVRRIDEARGNLRSARSTLLPTLDATATASRARLSGATLQLPAPVTANQFNLGLQSAYEIDLWGRLAAGRRGAESNLLATAYGAEVVRTALAAQVATAYFTLRALDAELQVTRDTLTGREENVRLQQTRFNAGVANEYELRLAQAERAAVAAAVPALTQAVAQTEAALAVLLGRSAREVFAPAINRGTEITAIAEPGEVPAELPSDLLTRRPDIRQAEALLVAANAGVAQARAQYFPSLSLTAQYGAESTQLSDLFTAPARVWALAGSLVQPIFNGGRIGGQVDAAQARREQARLSYMRSVQGAFRDAHDALVAHRAAREVFVAQDERRQRLAEALKLAQLRYRNGYSSYLEVLDAQRNLLDADRARLNALRDRQVALVDLYKALGGGWQETTVTTVTAARQ